MQEALPGFVAPMVGNEREHHDANDVGGEADGHDEDGERDVAQHGGVAHHVEVEQAEGFEREQGVQAGAGVGDQQLVLADLQHDAGAGDGVAGGVEDLLGDIADGHFHGGGERIDDDAGQRNHEQHEEQREPHEAHGGGATQQQEHAGDHPDQRADFKDEDALRATERKEQPGDDKHGPGECRPGVARGQAGHAGPFAPHQPERQAQHDGAMRLLVGGPDGAKQVDEGRHIHDHQAQRDDKPRREVGAGRGVCGGGGGGGGHGDCWRVETRPTASR